MIATIRRPLAAILALALAALAPTPRVAAETLVGANVDSRLVLALSVDGAAAQGWMPDGWTVAPFPEGPFAGANLLVVLIDQHVGYDAAGALADPPTRTAVALVSPGRATDGDEGRLFVTRIYSTNPAASPYGNTVAAQVSRSATESADAAQTRRRSEAWSVRPEEGGMLTVALDYAVGATSWSEGEARPHSAVEPDFYRIYRIDQLSDLAMSVPLGRPLDGAAEIASSIPELAAMFDGTEQLVAVVSVPVYIREIYLP